MEMLILGMGIGAILVILIENLLALEKINHQ